MEAIEQRIVPHLWFDKEAVEAAEFYASVFPDSAVTDVNTIRNTPSGDCDVVSFDVWRQKFMAISAGPIFKFNPSVSFIVNVDPLFFDQSSRAREILDEEPSRHARRLHESLWSAPTCRRFSPEMGVHSAVGPKRRLVAALQGDAAAAIIESYRPGASLPNEMRVEKCLSDGIEQ